MNLYTDEVTSIAPRVAAERIQADLPSSGFPAGSKRARSPSLASACIPNIPVHEPLRESTHLPLVDAALVDTKASSVALSDSVLEFGAVVGVPAAKFPSFSDAEFIMCRADSAPLNCVVDDRFFGAAHQLVLSQLIAQVKRDALRREQKAHATEQKREFRASVHVIDVGAGKMLNVKNCLSLE